MTAEITRVATRVLILNGVTLVPHLFSGHYALPGGMIATERDLLRRGAKARSALLWPKP
jgi:hypothetical protein